MGEIRDMYRAFTDQRDPFMRQGAENERFSVQLGAALLHSEIEQRQKHVVSTIGQKANRSLAATKVATLFPPNVQWQRLVVQADDPALKGNSQIEAALAEAERLSMQTFDETKCKAQLNKAFQHEQIVGQCVFHLKQEDDRGPNRARVIPLRKFVARWEDGFNTDIIVREESKDNPADASEEPKVHYTHVDFANNTLRQELPSDTIVDIDDGDNPTRWFIVAGDTPNTDFHYSFAYTTFWIAKIIHSNGLTRSIANIVYEAALIIKAVRQGSGLNPHKLSQLESGAYIVMRRPDDIWYPNQNSPLVPGLAIVAQERQATDIEILEAYLHGILERQPLPNTATLAEIIAAQQANVSQQFFAHHESYTLPALARALLDLNGIQIEGPNGRIVPSILTGLSAISRADEAIRLVQALEAMARMSPEWVAGLPMNKIAQRIFDGAQIETGDLIPTDATFQDALRTIGSLVQQDPQRYLPQLLKFIQAFDPEILSDVAGVIGTDQQPQQRALPPGSQEAVA